MSKEITNEDKERIYKDLLNKYNLSDKESIVVVSENSEKLKERLIYIIANNIL